jgi:hypothetical protein
MAASTMLGACRQQHRVRRLEMRLSSIDDHGSLHCIQGRAARRRIAQPAQGQCHMSRLPAQSAFTLQAAPSAPQTVFFSAIPVMPYFAV